MIPITCGCTAADLVEGHLCSRVGQVFPGGRPFDTETMTFPMVAAAAE